MLYVVCCMLYYIAYQVQCTGYDTCTSISYLYSQLNFRLKQPTYSCEQGIRNQDRNRKVANGNRFLTIQCVVSLSLVRFTSVYNRSLVHGYIMIYITG